MVNLVQILYLAEQQSASFSSLYIQLFSSVAQHQAEQQLCYLVLHTAKCTVNFFVLILRNKF